MSFLQFGYLCYSWSTWSVLKGCWIWAPRSRFTMWQVSFFRRFMNSTFAPGLNLDPPKVPVPDRGCVTEFVMFFSILFLKVGGEAPSWKYKVSVPWLAIKKSCPKKQKTTSKSKKTTSECFLFFFNYRNNFTKKLQYFFFPKVHVICSGLISWGIFVKNKYIDDIKLHIFAVLQIDPWIRDPGWVKNRDPDPGGTSRIVFPRA